MTNWNPPCGCRTFCVMCGACALCGADEPCYDEEGRETLPHHWRTVASVNQGGDE